MALGSKLKQFKANALAQAQKFDIGSIVPKYEELYNKVVKGLSV